MPIIPLVLVNGSEGIGTGWSSYIPNYNPRDIVANVRRLLNDETMEPMDPWYRGFKVISLIFLLVWKYSNLYIIMEMVEVPPLWLLQMSFTWLFLLWFHSVASYSMIFILVCYMLH